MADTKVDTSTEISAKDLKEKKLVEEAENGKDTPANGKAEAEENGEQDNDVDEDDEDVGEEEDEEEDVEGDEDEDDDDEVEGRAVKRAAEEDDDEDDEVIYHLQSTYSMFHHYSMSLVLCIEVKLDNDLKDITDHELTCTYTGGCWNEEAEN
uniref:Prothymosin alpha n=1 Tax=Esox lucius TaxID=8010 RepID=A0AAY5L7R1_ESOLU